MKKTALVVFLVLCMALTVLLSSCFDEESYYTKTDTESLVKTLEEALTEKVSANEAAITALKTEYEAKIKTLTDEGTALEAELAALKTAHEQKLAELDAANKATQSELDAFEAKYATDLKALQDADTANDAAIKALEKAHNDAVTELTSKQTATQSELDALETAYNTAVTEINGKLAANETAISTAKTELQNKLDTLAADHDSEIASINALITALQNTDTANEARIAALEQQVNALLSQHKHTFGDWVHFSGNENVYCENRLFYRICSQCHVLEWKQGSAADHDFETVTTAPTCQAGGFDTNTCTTCGKVEVTNHTDKVAHIYKTTYSYDGSYHWYNCQHCNAAKDKAEHNVNPTTGYCTACDQPIAGSEGIMYELSPDGTYAEVIGYEGTATKIVIADTYKGKPVTAIYRRAFKNDAGIFSVFIPASVTSIGVSAFYNCSRLTSVTFAEGSQLTLIGDSAFDYCRNLASINIPASVTSIDYRTFYGCSSLASVTFAEGSQLTSIGSDAFYNCSLMSITIPASVTSIGPGAFRYCSSLTSVTFSEGSQIQSVASGAFADCSKLQYAQYDNCKYLGTASNPYWVLISVTSTAYNSYTIHEQTKVITNYAFSACERLQSITIPASVTSIGDYAFRGCSSLTSMTLPFVGASKTASGYQSHFGYILGYSSSSSSYGGYHYYDSSERSYYTYHIPSTLKEITLTSCTSIGSSAFSGCSSLTSINIPAIVTSIGSRAFHNCSSLTSVTFENTTGWWRAYSSTDTSGTAISATDLENTSTAAKYLTDTYYLYYWKRS